MSNKNPPATAEGCIAVIVNPGYDPISITMYVRRPDYAFVEW